MSWLLYLVFLLCAVCSCQVFAITPPADWTTVTTITDSSISSFGQTLSAGGGKAGQRILISGSSFSKLPVNLYSSPDWESEQLYSSANPVFSASRDGGVSVFEQDSELHLTTFDGTTENLTQPPDYNSILSISVSDLNNGVCKIAILYSDGNLYIGSYTESIKNVLWETAITIGTTNDIDPVSISPDGMNAIVALSSPDNNKIVFINTDDNKIINTFQLSNVRPHASISNTDAVALVGKDIHFFHLNNNNSKWTDSQQITIDAQGLGPVCISADAKMAAVGESSANGEENVKIFTNDSNKWNDSGQTFNVSQYPAIFGLSIITLENSKMLTIGNPIDGEVGIFSHVNKN